MLNNIEINNTINPIKFLSLGIYRNLKKVVSNCILLNFSYKKKREFLCQKIKFTFLLISELLLIIVYERFLENFPYHNLYKI